MKKWSSRLIFHPPANWCGSGSGSGSSVTLWFGSGSRLLFDADPDPGYLYDADIRGSGSTTLRAGTCLRGPLYFLSTKSCMNSLFSSVSGSSCALFSFLMCQKGLCLATRLIRLSEHHFICIYSAADPDPDPDPDICAEPPAWFDCLNISLFVLVCRVHCTVLRFRDMMVRIRIQASY